MSRRTASRLLGRFNSSSYSCRVCGPSMRSNYPSISVIHSSVAAPSSSPTFSTSSSPSEFCDVLILGGGMVGGALACLLGSHPAFRDKRTIVLERGKRLSQVSSEMSAPFSNRVCELSPASVRFLDGLGVWELMKTQRVKPVYRMQVWDAASDSYIVFDSSSVSSTTSGDDVVSWTVENDVTTRAIESRLFSLADAGADVQLRHEMRVSDISLPGVDGKGGRKSKGAASPWPRVTLDDGGSIEARLIVGADGAQSAARAAAGIRTWDYDYAQMGLVATLKLEQAFGNTVAWQRFLASGPIAILPLDDYHSSLVWSVGVEEAERLVALEEEEFVREVNNAVWAEESKGAGAAVSVIRQMAGKYSGLLPTTSGRQLPPKIVGVSRGSRARFPLKMSHAADYVTSGLALVGDAAHRIHPMAGQGVNLGFGDAAKLGEILIDGAARGADIGGCSLLRPYETTRQRKVIPLIGGLQALHHIYGSNWSPLVALRSFGLQSVDALPMLKNAFAKFAMTH